MLVIDLTVFVTALGVVAFGLTQVVVPLWRGLPIFPAFRRRRLTTELAERREDVEEAKLEAEVKRLEREAGAQRRRSEMHEAPDPPKKGRR